jgi:UTP--glucose-1-phosphate uridylyltransferase
MHVLTAGIMEILATQIGHTPGQAVPANGGHTLAAALGELARHEQYLALELDAARYDVGVKYGLLTAQLALALSGHEREEVLARLLELLAQRETGK